MDSNKELGLRFYREVIGQLDEVVADSLIADDYIQHNPMIKTGKAGFLAVFAYLKQMPRPANPKSPIVRALAEDDLVALHLSVDIGGVNKSVIDLFRIEAGKLAEHWDVIEDHPAETASGLSMTSGAVDIVDLNKTATNKEIAANFYKAIWMDKDLSAIDQFVAADLIQHDPLVSSGKEALVEYIRSGIMSLSKVHRLIAEGNFVVAQLEAVLDEQAYAVYDILRLDAGKIIEQWRVKQPVPEVMAHNNGMF